MNTPLNNILSDESKWTKHAWARDADDNSILSLDQKACKWCLDGALRILNDHNVYMIVKNRVNTLGKGGIITYNDAYGTTFADIKELIKGL